MFRSVDAFDARAIESGGRNWPKIASYSANPHDGALFLREPRSIKGPARPRLIRARASLGESITCGRRRMRSSARWTAEVVSLSLRPATGRPFVHVWVRVSQRIPVRG